MLAWSLTFDMKEKLGLPSHSQGKNKEADLSFKNPSAVPEYTRCFALFRPIKRKVKMQFSPTSQGLHLDTRALIKSRFYYSNVLNILVGALTF